MQNYVDMSAPYTALVIIGGGPAGLSAAVGHCYPVFAHFRGGKGFHPLAYRSTRIRIK